MATNTPFPDFFLPAPGEPAIPFKSWVKIFQNYCLVIDVEGQEWTGARQRALLLHCLGTEGQRIFYTLPNTGDTLATALTSLHGYFTPKVNVVVERHTFRKQVQLADESIIQYVTALRQLAATCEFANGDDMIRDQLVEHVAHARIRERLLLKQKLTLEDAVTIASQMESAGEQAKCMTKSGLPVQAVQVHSTTSTAMEKCASGVIYRSVHRQFHSCYKFPCLLSLWIRQASGKCTGMPS